MAAKVTSFLNVLVEPLNLSEKKVSEKKEIIIWNNWQRFFFLAKYNPRILDTADNLYRCVIA